MPVYFLHDDEMRVDLIIEAKSETAARLHWTRRVTCEVIGAQRMAALVMEGVKVERAGKEDETVQAALRG